MLVLERKVDESVVIAVAGVTIEVFVTSVRGNKVRIGFDAPVEAKVNRKEVHQKLHRKEK